MATNISKQSGVISVTVGAAQPLYYFGATGSYVPFDDSTGFIVTIRQGVNENDTYKIALSDLTVNGQTPENFTTAKVLLNAVFGT